MSNDPTESDRSLRRHAEEIARLDESAILKTLSLEDAQHLLHELRLYQIELEMQNDELRRTQHELEVSRSRYFDLYDLAPVGYLTLSLEGLIKEANLGAATMLGMARRDLLKRPISKFIFSEDEDFYYLHRKKTMDTGNLQALDLRLVRADGTPFWVHLQAVAQANAEVRELLVTLNDITDEKDAEQKLLRAKEAAEAANIAKSDFLATMSHEIRTPLGAVLGNIELLEGSPLAMEQQEYLKDCKSASQMLLQVINDVLDFSKIEAGKLELVSETFSISTLCTQLVRIFKASAQQKGLDLTTSLSDDLPEYIRCDQQRLRQIIANLLGNAIKFTHHGKVSLQIVCAQAPTGDKPDKAVLQIIVSDSGIGIPPDKHNHIFNSFTQVESFTTRSMTGTGLGLSICRRLLTLMGGSITVSSVPDEGSVFNVLLPVIVCPAQAKPEAPPQTLAEIPPRKILLADDDCRGRTVAQKLLQRRGYKVTAVENGAGILEALQKEVFEIVLTDISMPDMDGIQVARIIRSGDRPGINQHIPIIAMTAHAFSDDRARFMASGINGYVAKPVNIEELFRQIEEMCGGG